MPEVLFFKALITGATSGIGEELARLLADKGINLILSGRNSQKLDVLKKELSSKVSVEVIVADLASAEGRKRLIDALRQQSPDLVVNNAGYGSYGEALTYTTLEQMTLFEVNARASLELTLEAARAMLSQNKRGTILNISSSAAFQPCPSFAIYSAAKAAVVQFSESLDFELRDRGVRVLVACPGMVATNFRSRASGGAAVSDSVGGVIMSAQFAAEELWNQLRRKKRMQIFNWKYRLAAFLSRYCLPKAATAWAVARNIKGRHRPRDYLFFE